MSKDPTDYLLEREKSKKLRQMSAKMGFRPPKAVSHSLFPTTRPGAVKGFVLEGLPMPEKQFTAEGWV
jgi:hypothetical protein